jgi:hypothetical protein
MRPDEDYAINPRSIRLDASTLCQLRCPSCPTGTGQTAKSLGEGYLSFADFRRIVDENPRISKIELSNWGEPLLNPDLPRIVKYAYRRGVAMHAGNGVNLNTASEDVLEALVKYKLRTMTVSIDGASQKTYPIYRVKGDFDTVIGNIRKINALKTRYRSRYPELRWQYIIFGHNETEIGIARRMAAELDMGFRIKLPWDDLYTESFSPVRDLELVRRESGLGVATRDEYRERYGQEYMLPHCCLAMWASPQINFDGRLLGCPVKFWADYGNVLEDGLLETLNNEKIAYARQMLMGRAPERGDIPCLRCKAYQKMKATGRWLKEGEIRQERPSRRVVVLSQNRILGFETSQRVVDAWRVANRTLRVLRREEEASIGNLTSIIGSRGRSYDPPLDSQVRPLDIPLPQDGEQGWMPHPLFRGSTRGIHDLSCHASVLAPGSCPHPPHAHQEEELLLLLSGQVEIILPDLRDPGEEQTRRLVPGRLVYYPYGFSHTLTTVSDEAANYLMFKWTCLAREKESELGFGEFDLLDPGGGFQTKGGFNIRVVFEGPTGYLGKLQCHTSTLPPGVGYEPHADKHDVCIVVLEGEVETIGQRVRPHGVIYYAPGKPHGMRNPGGESARYVVFEFHR